jgi:type IV secretion system protein VirB4
LLWFDAMASERTIINKDGALMACLSFQGVDLHSALDSALVVQALQLNNLLRRFDAGWGVLTEARRREVRTYPQSQWPIRAAALVDAERRALFETPGMHYVTTCTLTLTYQRPHKPLSRWQRWLYQNLPDESETASVAQFETDIRRVIGLLSEACAEVRWLERDELLTYLHSTISWKAHRVSVPEPACYLDSALTDTDLELVWCLPHVCRYPKLGTQFLRCVSAKVYPRATNPGMLDVLDTLPLEYRACVRFLPISRTEAVSAARKYGDSHYGKRTRAGGSTARVEQIALDYSQEATAFQAGVEHGQWSAGTLTQTVVVWGETFVEATRKAEQVEQALNAVGYVARVETVNTLAAWDGTLPGNTYRNARKPLMTSANMSHLFPACQQTQGPPWNAHLNGPPLLHTIGRGHTPFALDTYEDDTGHLMVIGPPGAGKSFLLALLAAQWLKYPGGPHVYAFDKDQSMRCMTYAVGGQWHDLGEDLEVLSHAGTRLDAPDMRPWTVEWSLPEGRWFCFETAALMDTPAMVSKVLAPICRTIESRMTGQPVQIIFDESWQFLGHEFFQGKMRDYLLTMRKKNGMAIFCSQNIAHFADSAIGSDVFQACMARIYLANHHALEPATYRLYSDLGLNARQIELIARLTPKKTYYYQGPHGASVFELQAGPVQRALAGSSRKEDLALMADMYKSDPERFLDNWLHAKGVTVWCEPSC